MGRAWSGVGGSPDTVDGRDRVPVPPDKPGLCVALQVWISGRGADGYYYGLANEGLWPKLCHIAFVRPTFRERDWAHYVEVDQSFADVVIEEADRDDPIVLVQDYHFALLPRSCFAGLTLRDDHRVLAHSPWPNPGGVTGNSAQGGSRSSTGCSGS